MPKSPAKLQKPTFGHTKSISKKIQVKKKSQPFFSIVIPTLNEEKYLPLLLQDLVVQSYQDFEVIVVDGQSTDQTVTKANKFAKSLHISVCTSTETGVANQRNLGIKHAQGVWILFMDADNRLPTYFLDGIRYQIAKNKRVDIFTCLMAPDSSSPPVQVIARTINTIMLLHEFRDYPFAMGALIGVKKEIATQHQFDINLALAEDHAFTREIHDIGHHFQVFREPQFTYSLRRLRKEGALKMAAIEAKILLNSISKSTKNSNFGYVMKGGGYYSQTSSTSTRQAIKGITKQQWQRLSSFVQKSVDRYF